MRDLRAQPERPEARGVPPACSRCPRPAPPLPHVRPLWAAAQVGRPWFSRLQNGLCGVRKSRSQPFWEGGTIKTEGSPPPHRCGRWLCRKQTKKRAKVWSLGSVFPLPQQLLQVDNVHLQVSPKFVGRLNIFNLNVRAYGTYESIKLYF